MRQRNGQYETSGCCSGLERIHALGSVAAACGISEYVTLFVCLCSTAVWHLKFTNNEFIPLLGVQNGEMCEHEDTMPFNYAYMVINMIGCLASVPVWQMLGLM